MVSFLFIYLLRSVTGGGSFEGVLRVLDVEGAAERFS
jgi:hypothetical protein